MLETFHQILRTCLPQQKLCYADFFKVAPKVNDGKLSSTVGTLLHTAFSQIQNNSKIWRILYLSVISDTCLYVGNLMAVQYDDTESSRLQI